MIGLVDCNNFYVSCERVFAPDLNGRAVVVLSNNDGCVIARSSQAKLLGIQMGTPAFQIRHLITSGTLVALSSNYKLYGDMSGRVMSILADIVGDLEIYSIDEAFFTIPDNADFVTIGHQIADQISRGTGIPVSIGIAKTKTLAKVANHAAKKYPGYKKVCVIQNDAQRIVALDITPLDEVWGIGRRYGQRLANHGIKTALDFANMPRDLVRKIMTVTGERAWCELRGQSCINIDSAPHIKRQICKSRSFGTLIDEYEQLVPAIATFAGMCAEKLRAGDLCAAAVGVFITTNKFRMDLPQYAMYTTMPLSQYTGDTRIISSVAQRGLREIFRPNYKYHKAGVIISDILPRDCLPLDLFSTGDGVSDNALMSAIDNINHKYGRGTVQMLAQIADNTWQNRHDMLSPNYTTDIHDIIKIKCIQ
ncbi:MAG: Y-family DNA polymerase [Muribaculaceae bacterium]|nr:Y-family DNA polymerase [Muribaculaceae bacterium]